MSSSYLDRFASLSPNTQEHTPLLRKTLSLYDSLRPSQVYTDVDISNRYLPSNTPPSPPSGSQPPSVLSPETDVTETNFGAKSTYGQTLFNSIAILIGIGMLSEPLAFAYAGWIGGTLLIVSYGFISCYTSKILARIILADPHLRSYADIGRKAFGPRSTILTSILFCLELFSVSVILVTLFADSLHTVAPAYSANTYKLLGLFVLLPTVFLPLSLLSYTSILGIISTLLVIVVIFIDGFSVQDGPGSLWSPADTAWGIDTPTHLGIAFGLFMAGFSGHAVIPSLARDMVDPLEFDKMINWAFVVATLVYTMIGYAGYLMFGASVSDEISVDLMRVPGYNSLLNQVVLWMLVISPLSKFALTTRPIIVVLETMLSLEAGFPQSPHERKPVPIPSTSTEATRYILVAVERTLLTLLSVTVSILVPDFSSMMAFLGSFSAFMICIIGPISAKAALTGKCGLFDAFVLSVGCVMAVWGTLAAFTAE